MISAGRGIPGSSTDSPRTVASSWTHANLLAAEETLQRIYDTIPDKPEKIVKYENAPRPDGV
jgi:uridylate kinase